MSSLEQVARQWGVPPRLLIYRQAELGLVTEAAVRKGLQRFSDNPQADELLAAYPGENPGLLREAVELADGRGFRRHDVAAQLCWTERQLGAALGEEKASRTQLTVIR